MRHNQQFLVIVFSIWQADMILARIECPEEVSSVDATLGIIQRPRWPRTLSHTEVYSEPLCLSEDFTVIQRECTETWLPQEAPHCSYVSPRKSKLYCPPGYTVVGTKSEYVCLTISKEKWSNTCRFSPKAFDDVTEDQLIAIFKHLQERGIHMSWLPIKRLDTFGPLLWTIPGPLWSSRFDISKEFEVTYGDRSKGCLVLDVSQRFRVKAESCTASHPYLCVVEKNYFVQGACPADYYASPIPRDNRCFSLMTSDDDINWQNAMRGCSTAQVDSPLIEQLFSGLARKNNLKETDFCWIGGNGRYSSNTMAMTVAGDLTNFNTTTNLHCVFCQMDTPTHPATSISLKFHKNEGQLRLSVYGEEGLWKLSSSDPGVQCFTNANGDLIRNAKLSKVWDKRWTEKDIEPDIDFEDRVDLEVDIHKTIYRVKLSDRGPGYYVCEAHTISGELLTTKRVIAYKNLKGHVFALGLEVLDACQSIERCDPTFLKMYIKLTKDLEAVTTEHLIEDIRTMQIVDITRDGNVTALFHVTAENFDDEEEFNDESETNAFMRSKRLFQLLAAMNPRRYKFLFLHSCDGCLRSVTGKHESQLVWPYTYVGITAVSEEICLDSTGLPVHRICKGNYMRGGAWSTPSGDCVSEILPATNRLYNISKIIHKSPAVYNRELGNEVLSIVESIEQLTVADIYFLSKIIDYEAKTYKTTEILLEDIFRISIILDKVMTTDEQVLKRSQILNSTDILLDSLSTLLDFASMNISSQYLSEHDGLISVVTSQLIIYILDPNITNISGLALINNSTHGIRELKSFLDFSVVPLSADHTIENVAGLGEVDVATWLPRNLLDEIIMPNYTNFNNSLENSTSNYEAPRIVVTLFYSNVVFSSELVGQNNEVNSRVISVSIPGYGANLPFPIPLLFKPLKGASRQTKTCAYWDFDYVGISTTASFSAWSEDGCQNSGRTRDLSGELNVCLCSHLTHFAQLVLGHFPGPGEVGDPGSIYHGAALEVITVVGCVLSMVGVFGILITATVFKTWRKKPGSKVLIQLSLALGLEKFMLGILPMVDPVANPIPCIITGAVLHYSVLAEFSWMLITAWLQFKRYVTVLGATRPPRFLLKASAFAWGVPLIIVSLVTAIDPYVYMPKPDSGISYCQVSGIAQYAGLLAPVILVICLNVFLFIRVIYSILGTRKKGPGLEDDKSLVIAQLRLGIMLFFLLGITWVFGLVARMGGGLLFSYLFCITAALQGFVLFMFFIICDPATRNLWYSLIKLRSRSSNTVTPSGSASSGISDYSQRY